jgi:hypothetical protein
MASSVSISLRKRKLKYGEHPVTRPCPYDGLVKRTLLAGLAALAAVATAAAATVPAPPPGPFGPEGVPIPKGPVLANVQRVKLGQTIGGVTCQRAEKIAFHIHAHLTLFVGTKAYQVPYGIGIGPPLQGLNTKAGPFVSSGSCFMWLHTHASDGIIHMEAPKQMSFTLGQFFAIWGISLTSTRVGPARGNVTAFYNGKPWTKAPAAIPLTGEAQIQLDVGKPVVAPEHIVFPKALAGSTSKTG